MKPAGYNSTYAYLLGMIDVLTIFSLYFLYKNGGALAARWSIPKRYVERLEIINQRLLSIGVFIFGWLIGDYMFLVVSQ